MLSGHRELLPRPVQQPERLSGEEGRRSDLGGMRRVAIVQFFVETTAHEHLHTMLTGGRTLSRKGKWDIAFNCSPCCLFKLPVGSGAAEPGQMAGDPVGAVGGERGSERSEVERSIEGPVQAESLEVAGGDRDAAAPGPERAIERPEFGETPARRDR